MVKSTARYSVWKEKEMALEISRQAYAEHYGPTVGDQLRLGDTELFIEVERDFIAEAGGYGNEVKFGGGKVIRDGMGQSSTALDAESLDLVVTNATLIDAELGVIKADVGDSRRADCRDWPCGKSGDSRGHWFLDCGSGDGEIGPYDHRCGHGGAGG